MIVAMAPAVILVFLLAGLLALVPIWRLRAADWPPAWLFAAWATYGVMILIVMRFAGVTRFLLPILIVTFLAPFVVGPERLARLVPRRREPERTVIDVTPAPPDGLPDPTVAPGPPVAKPVTRAPRRTGRGLRADPPGAGEDEA
jgi:hypothetical protein